nr:FIST C-terminal domain-containing protein [candidate division Zixibacteria bacterium]
MVPSGVITDSMVNYNDDRIIMITHAPTEKIKDKVAIQRGYTNEPDEEQAVLEMSRHLNRPEVAVVFLFCSSKYNLDRLGRAIKNAFEVPVIGCTTAGEISPEGYKEGSLTGFSIVGDSIKVSSFFIRPLERNSRQILELTVRANDHLAGARKTDPEAKAFGFLMIDGMSVKEEHIVAGIYSGLPDIPLIGGSAGDDLTFEKTFIYHDGAFVSDAAVFNLFITSLPFHTFNMHHFVPTEQKLVITAADPRQRIIREIDGFPAAERYAELIGHRVEDLSPVIFSKYPIMLKIGGKYYVRSIQKANTDGGLTMYCAIEEGLVLTLGLAGDLMANLEENLKKHSGKVNDLQIIIGCECILRRLEVLEKNLVESVDYLMRKYKVIGFHSYGEQVNSIHVNQTFTGVAIGG